MAQYCVAGSEVMQILETGFQVLRNAGGRSATHLMGGSNIRWPLADSARRTDGQSWNLASRCLSGTAPRPSENRGRAVTNELDDFEPGEDVTDEFELPPV